MFLPEYFYPKFFNVVCVLYQLLDIDNYICSKNVVNNTLDDTKMHRNLYIECQK